MIGRSLRFVTLAIALLAAAPAFAANITAENWGTTAKGEKVQLFTLKGAGGLEADISNFGGVIVKLMVPDRNGKKVDVLLGYDSFAEYEKGGVYGAIIGRYAGRISHGGSFPLNGKTYQLEKPNPDAKSVIHGGTAGFQKKVWKAVMHDGAEPSLTLTVMSPNGDGGFPGALTASVTYTVTRDNGLRLDYRATSDRPTIANLTNHAYFALQGEGNGDVSDQMLQVFASKFAPQDADILVTGEILPVDGTPFDFHQPVRIGNVLSSAFPQIAMRGGLDICMIVDGKPGTLRKAARLSEPATGIVMDVSTTQPAVQLYSDGVGTRTSIGKTGKVYRSYYSMSLETQHYLDAPNQPKFPPAVVAPGKSLHETTLFRFSTQP